MKKQKIYQLNQLLLKQTILYRMMLKSPKVIRYRMIKPKSVLILNSSLEHLLLQKKAYIICTSKRKPQKKL